MLTTQAQLRAAISDLDEDIQYLKRTGQKDLVKAFRYLRGQYVIRVSRLKEAV